jgi:disulfide bond formation protein DsbB
MRLSMLGCVVVALFIAVYQVVNRIEPESLELILVLLGAGFTAKVAQKVVEEKKDTPPQ